MGISSYKSVWIKGSETKLLSVIPASSIIISILIEVQNDATGTVTLSTESVDGLDPSRIIYIDYITASGFYTGNSAKEYFISRQNLTVKITGNLTVRFKILFWETEK